MQMWWYGRPCDQRGASRFVNDVEHQRPVRREEFHGSDSLEVHEVHD